VRSSSFVVNYTSNRFIKLFSLTRTVLRMRTTDFMELIESFDRSIYRTVLRMLQTLSESF